jgi:hypothetical protein
VREGGSTNRGHGERVNHHTPHGPANARKESRRLGSEAPACECLESLEGTREEVGPKSRAPSRERAARKLRTSPTAASGAKPLSD